MKWKEEEIFVRSHSEFWGFPPRTEELTGRLKRRPIPSRQPQLRKITGRQRKRNCHEGIFEGASQIVSSSISAVCKCPPTRSACASPRAAPLRAEASLQAGPVATIKS